jgi:hypothetical protein
VKTFDRIKVFLVTFCFAFNNAWAYQQDLATGAGGTGITERGPATVAPTDTTPGRKSPTAPKTEPTLSADQKKASIKAPGVKQQAEKAQSTQNQGTILGTIATAGLTAKAVVACAAQPPVGCEYWVAGAVLAGVVTLSMSSSAKKSGQSVQDYSSKINATGSNGLDPKNHPKYAQIQKDLAKLEQNGIEVNLEKGTATFKNGKTISTSDLRSPQAMQAAGLDPAAFAKVMKDAQEQAGLEASSLANVEVNEALGDPSGGGGTPGAKAAGTQVVMLPGTSGAVAAGLGINRDPAQVQGLSVKYGGELIGVAADSLFDIQSRRYKFEVDGQTLVTP